jgi:hypothetical protein
MLQDEVNMKWNIDLMFDSSMFGTAVTHGNPCAVVWHVSLTTARTPTLKPSGVNEMYTTAHTSRIVYYKSVGTLLYTIPFASRE